MTLKTILKKAATASLVLAASFQANALLIEQSFSFDGHTLDVAAEIQSTDLFGNAFEVESFESIAFMPAPASMINGFDVEMADLDVPFDFFLGFADFGKVVTEGFSRIEFEFLDTTTDFLYAFLFDTNSGSINLSIFNDAISEFVYLSSGNTVISASTPTLTQGADFVDIPAPSTLAIFLLSLLAIGTRARKAS